MAQSVSTVYYKNATARCLNCGSVYTLGMTIENLTLEICGNCHPFYTGQEGTLVDTAGRVEKFRARLAKAKKANKKEENTGKASRRRRLRQSMASILESDQEENKQTEKDSAEQTTGNNS